MKKLLLILSLSFASYNLCQPIRILHTSDATAVTMPEELANFSNTLRNYASDCTAGPDGMLPFDLNKNFSSHDLTNCVHYLNVLARGQDVVPLIQAQNLAANCQLLKVVDFFDIPQLYEATVTEIAHKLALPTTLNEFRTRPDFMERFAGLPTHDIVKELKLQSPFIRANTPVTNHDTEYRWDIISPDGDGIYTIDSGNITIRDDAGQPLLDLRAAYLRFFTASHNKRLWVIIRGDETAAVLRADSSRGEDPLLFALPVNDVKSATFNHDDTRIVTAGHHGTAVWNSRGEQLFVLPTGNTCYAAFSRNDNRIVTVSDNSVTTVWDTHTREPLFTIPANGVRSAAFSSRDDNYIVTAGYHGTVVWNSRGEQLFALPTGGTRYAAFSRNDNRIITAGGDGTFVWENVLASIKGNTMDALAQSLFVLLLKNSQQPVELSQAHVRNIFDTFSEREQLHILKTYQPRQNLGNIISNLFTSTEQHPRSTTTLANIGMAATTRATALGMHKLLRYKK